MCTAQLAYDSSRPMRDLELVDFMENNTNNRDNALALQDKSTKWAPAVYVKLLEIAGRCTKDNKRNRPDMKEVKTFFVEHKSGYSSSWQKILISLILIF